MNSSILSDEYVQVPVPKRYVTQVYGFIASLDQQDPTEAKPLPVVLLESALDPYNGWSEDLIRKQYKQSPETMKKFQKVLAEHPDKEYTSEELANAIGLEYGWNSIAGALGAYQRRIQNRYGMKTWPFSASYDADGHSYFSVSPQVAEIIRSL